jgi:hypothetical protein
MSWIITKQNVCLKKKFNLTKRYNVDLLDQFIVSEQNPKRRRGQLMVSQNNQSQKDIKKKKNSTLQNDIM